MPVRWRLPATRPEPGSSPGQRRRAAETRGRRAETLAALLLRARGYRILARRARTPAGEIDIVARRGGTLVFVEVKARPQLIEAAEAIGPRARARIAAAAEAWQALHPALAGLDARFDAMLISPWRWPVHVVDAFQIELRLY